MHYIDEISLSAIKNLNSKILNNSFTKLIENDIEIFPVNNYMPKIWENMWFNNNAIAGYSKGDVVWKGAYSFKAFLSSYSTSIQGYASNNSMLKGYFQLKPEWAEMEMSKYQNVVSGYADENNPQTQLLPPLFDPGNISQTDSLYTNTVISLYISTIDNNKEQLSNTSAWKPVALTSDQAFDQYIENEISLLFDKHVKEYHLNGAVDEDDFQNALLRRDFSNFSPDNFYNDFKIKKHDVHLNQQGIDYVIEFIKQPVPMKSNPGYNLYRWFRQWHSGYLEHGGIVEFDQLCADNEAENAITAKVDLNWEYYAGSEAKYAPIYDYPRMLSANAMSQILNFKDGYEVKIDNMSDFLRKDLRYSVTLTPLDFTEDYLMRDNVEQLKYKDISETSSLEFLKPQEKVNGKSYINTEVFALKNTSFCVSRSLLDEDMLSSSNLRFLQYYAAGYNSNPDMAYYIEACSVLNLQAVYEYTGEQVRPDVVIVSNTGVVLVEGVDYELDYGPNVEIGEGFIEVFGISPWRGSMSRNNPNGVGALTFQIKHKLSDEKYTLTGYDELSTIEYR